MYACNSLIFISSKYGILSKYQLKNSNLQFLLKTIYFKTRQHLDNSNTCTYVSSFIRDILLLIETCSWLYNNIYILKWKL